MATNTFLNKKFVFNTIYTENWKGLYVFALKILQNKESAEDVLQEIFTDFWVRMEHTEIASHKAYLYQAVRNQCAKKFANKSLTTVELELLAQSFLLADEEETAAIPCEELVYEVYKAAETLLPPKCHQIFTLRFSQQMSIADIALLLEISSSTVENQINKALKILRSENIGNLAFALLIACAN